MCVHLAATKRQVVHFPKSYRKAQNKDSLYVYYLTQRQVTLLRCILSENLCTFTIESLMFLCTDYIVTAATVPTLSAFLMLPSILLDFAVAKTRAQDIRRACTYTI